MKYTLIGSYPSPFVRRIRLAMELIPYEFKPINIYEKEGGEELKKVNPIHQIPVLLAGEQKIWDSRVIFNYLNVIHRLENLDWEDENNLSAISSAMDAGVALLMMKRSGIDTNQDLMLVKRHRERIDSILHYFTPYVQGKGLEEWRFLTMSIYSFMDWAGFRAVLELNHYPAYKRFLETHAERDVVKLTQIPKDA
jgi:glutathione S-transferase